VVAVARGHRAESSEVVTAMHSVGRVLVLAWLLAALVVLGLDGRLPAFLAWTVPSSLVVLVASSVARHQLAAPKYNRPPLPERYRVADDLRQPVAAVVAVAEAEAMK
jgi:hypothetical protein